MILEMYSIDTSTLKKRGRAKSSLNDQEGAIQDFSKAIKINPEDIYALFCRGHS